MDTPAKQILIADDDEGVRVVLRSVLQKAGYEVVEATDGVVALEKMTDEISVVLLDNQMPRMNGMECLDQIAQSFPRAEVIMLSAGGVPDAVIALKKGAYWYLQKPVYPAELVVLIGRALELAKLREEQSELLEAVRETTGFSTFFDPRYLPKEVLAQVKKMNAKDSDILITGETGIGKTTLARYLHQSGKRKSGPFTSLACSNIPRDLLEAELFGYERGAFRGAKTARPGKVEIANGGTVFVDEIGELPLDLQVKTRAFLETHSIRRVGASRSKKVDSRFVAATYQNLEKMAVDKKFNEELSVRLNTNVIQLPALRERREGIHGIAQIILDRISERNRGNQYRFERPAMRKLRDYDWPGNIRELENTLERAVSLSDSPTISRDLLLLGGSIPRTQLPQVETALAGFRLVDIEKSAIAQTIDLCNGNKKEAARRLGISEKSIYNKIQRTT